MPEPTLLDQIALVASIVMPLWNIPLIFRIIKRRSSGDISRVWAVGVWLCFVLMLPSALQSPELVWKVFTLLNVLLFGLVALCTLFFYKKSDIP